MWDYQNKLCQLCEFKFTLQQRKYKFYEPPKMFYSDKENLLRFFRHAESPTYFTFLTLKILIFQKLLTSKALGLFDMSMGSQKKL